MLVDLNLSGRNALVIAQREEAEIRARQLRSEGANVTVLLIGSPARELRDASSFGKLALNKNGKSNRWKSVIKEAHPFLAVISSGNPRTDQNIAKCVRKVSRLVYVVDRPKLNDLNMTAVAKIGDIRVAVSTRGLSPAMASLLKRKIESLISKEDVLQVRLQGETRGKIKQSIKDPLQRKELIYKLIRNKKIFSLLKSDRFEEAKLYALNIIAAYNNRSRKVVRISE